MKTLDELFTEEEAIRANLPEETADQIKKRKDKAKAEHDRGIALGWFDADGNPLLTDDEDDGDDDENP